MSDDLIYAQSVTQCRSNKITIYQKFIFLIARLRASEIKNRTEWSDTIMSGCIHRRGTLSALVCDMIIIV